MPEHTETFSNPLAPAHMQHDAADSQPLTNDDFRKLMMTPRVPSAKSSVAATPTPRSSAVVKGKGETDEAFAKRKEKKIYYARLRKEEEERQKKLNEKYRDRATERRSGQNKDYAETETISTTADYRAVAPSAQQDLGNAERRNQLIQESKYLGGDMEHTHLVKGLDYALLEKVRTEIVQKEEQDEVDMEEIVEAQDKHSEQKSKEEQPDEDKHGLKSKLARNIYRLAVKKEKPDRSELFAPGRMAYRFELEDDYTETDIPTTIIRSKADVQNKEASTTLTTNDIVINKLTQIFSYLRVGKRDKKKKLKEKAKVKDDDKAYDEGIYGDMGDYTPTIKKKEERERDRKDKSDRDRRDRRDQDRDRDRDRDSRRSGRHERSSTSGTDRKRSYFEKPADEADMEVDKNLPINARELVDTINTRFASHAPQQASWTEKFPTAAEQKNEMDAAEQQEQETSNKAAPKRKSAMDSSYAECYPGLEEAYDALGDSDDEVDYTKMDQGNKKGPVGRWDFDTQEEYSDYMANKEALPKAAFQYGVKMADGRRTRRTGPKDQKKELDREWQKIQNIISKRKQMGEQGPKTNKQARY